MYGILIGFAAKTRRHEEFKIESPLQHYSELGIYDIQAKAKDINDRESIWSDIHKILVGNFAPSDPEITGPLTAKINTEIEYTFVSTDPNDDDLQYTINWGDGSSEDWFGPYSSGEEVKMSHSWSKEGSWYLEAKVKDEDGAESGWSQVVITIPRTKQRFDILFSNIWEQFPYFYRIIERLFYN